MYARNKLKYNHTTYRKKHSKHSKHSKKHLLVHSGGDAFGKLAGMAIKQSKNLRTTTGVGSINKLMSLQQTFKTLSKPKAFLQVIFNYGSQNEIYIDNTNKIISHDLYAEPRVLIDNIGRYLIAIIEKQPFSQLLWLAIYNARSKEKTLLTYQAPNPPAGQTRAYSILLFSITEKTPIYQPIDYTTNKRKDELLRFMIYIKQNLNNIKQLPQHTKLFSVKGNSDSLSSFMNSMIIKRKHEKIPTLS